MAGKEKIRLREFVDIEECYVIDDGNFHIYVQVPVPEDDDSRRAAKGLISKLQTILREMKDGKND